MKIRSLSILMFMLTIVGAAFAGTNTDWDKTVNFSQFKTYTWIKVKTPNEIWDKRVMDAIDAQLQAKGWTKAEQGADVGIVAIGTTQNEQSLDTYYNGFGGGWGWRGWGGYGTATTQVYNYRVGTLIVDMYTESNKALIWRGVSSDTLSDKPEKNVKKMNDKVKDMFKKFPPAPSTK
jgi:hypothetical protein